MALQISEQQLKTDLDRVCETVETVSALVGRFFPGVSIAGEVATMLQGLVDNQAAFDEFYAVLVKFGLVQA